MEKVYPYLGVNDNNSDPYIVLFTEADKGMVVVSPSNNERIKFGMYSDFDETKFTYLPKEQCVRLNN